MFVGQLRVDLISVGSYPTRLQLGWGPLLLSAQSKHLGLVDSLESLGSRRDSPLRLGGLLAAELDHGVWKSSFGYPAFGTRLTQASDGQAETQRSANLSRRHDFGSRTDTTREQPALPRDSRGSVVTREPAGWGNPRPVGTNRPLGVAPYAMRGAK